MSVNAKMTALADKIRSLLGTTETMGLDAMAANLQTEKTNVTNAFTAIGNKGGTVPASKISGNLASAVNSIPDFIPVQRLEGTVTITYDAEKNTYVSCGFTPDLVMIHNLIYTGSSSTQSEYQLAAFLSEQKEGYRYVYEGYTDDPDTGWKQYTLEMYPTENGFRLYDVYCYDSTNEYYYCEGDVLHYLAIKFTA